MYSVLVVDDEIRQREAVIRNVDWQRAGFEVVGDAENGIEALDPARKARARFGFDGYQDAAHDRA